MAAEHSGKGSGGPVPSPGFPCHSMCTQPGTGTRTDILPHTWHRGRSIQADAWRPDSKTHSQGPVLNDVPEAAAWSTQAHGAAGRWPQSLPVRDLHRTEGKTCTTGREQGGQEERGAIPKEKTRSPLDSTTTVLATRNYWGGRSSKGTSYSKKVRLSYCKCQ